MILPAEIGPTLSRGLCRGGECRLVAFDNDFRRNAGLALLHLVA
jgi:hypothetical protein